MNASSFLSETQVITQTPPRSGVSWMYYRAKQTRNQSTHGIRFSTPCAKIVCFYELYHQKRKMGTVFCKKLINSFLFFPICGKYGKEKAAPVSGAAHWWTWRDSPSRALKKPRRDFLPAGAQDGGHGLFDSLLVPPRKGKDKTKAQPLGRCCALANDSNCDTNAPPLALGGSLCTTGVHSNFRSYSSAAMRTTKQEPAL